MKTLVVIGGGAAGFFCAVNAARMHNELHVIVLEKSNKLLSKVKVSGGGRCNVTHHGLDRSELVAKYPRGKNFLKKIFHQFSPNDAVQWYEERGVKLKVESDGRMFPTTNSSQTIIDCLLREADKYNVDIVMNTSVSALDRRDNIFAITTNHRTYNADYVCVASGGFSKLEHYQWIQALGHTIQHPKPSLFTFNIPKHPICELMGLSVPNASVKIISSKLQDSGPLLITHWGLSGPAILKLSAWGASELAERNYHFDILVNWLGDQNEQELRDTWPSIRMEQGSKIIDSANPFALPNRLWKFLLAEAGINLQLRWSDLKSVQQNKLIQLLTAHPFSVQGKTTFKEEFVTCGGVSLSEINPNTMESRIVKGLYFAGEIIDVDGITGGFNFQNAWTTGYVASRLV